MLHGRISLLNKTHHWPQGQNSGSKVKSSKVDLSPPPPPVSVLSPPSMYAFHHIGVTVLRLAAP